MRQFQPSQDNDVSSTHLLRRHILSLLQEHRQVRTAPMSDLFAISEVSIRKDLDWLNAHLSRRERARAHQQSSAQRYQRIGALAASFVLDGDCVALDASPLCQAMTPFLLDKQDATVITNGLNIAMTLVQADSIAVLMSGGVLCAQSSTLVSSWGEVVIPEMAIQTAFISAHGLSFDEGLSSVNHEEASWKRAVAESASQVIILLDATYWGQVAFRTFCPLDRIAGIITSDDAPPALIQQARELGLEVWLASENDDDDDQLIAL